MIQLLQIFLDVLSCNKLQSVKYNFLITMMKALLLILFLVLTLSFKSKDDNSHSSQELINSCVATCQGASDQNSCARACRDDSQTERSQERSQQESIFTFAHEISGASYIDETINEAIGIQQALPNQKGELKNPVNLDNLKKVLNNNKKWAQDKKKVDQDFFKRHSTSQFPQYLWIGCSDSRLNANQILGLDYGQIFILRNVANIVSPSDISAVAVIQYAVEVLKVKDIIVAGHYGCGGVRAAVTKFNHGPLEAWLSKLRRISFKHAKSFENLTTIDEKARLLVQINVKEQVFNVASLPFIQQAWKDKQQVNIHGLVYNMMNGRLIDLGVTIHTLDQLPPELTVIQP